MIKGLWDGTRTAAHHNTTPCSHGHRESDSTTWPRGAASGEHTQYTEYIYLQVGDIRSPVASEGPLCFNLVCGVTEEVNVLRMVRMF